MRRLLRITAASMISITIICSAGSRVSGASGVAAPRQWAYYTYPYVSVIVVDRDGYLSVGVAGNYDTEFDGCGNNAFGTSMFPITDDRTKAMMTAAYASLLGQIPVVVWTRGCVNDDATGYRIIEALEIATAGVPGDHARRSELGEAEPFGPVPIRTLVPPLQVITAEP